MKMIAKLFLFVWLITCSCYARTALTERPLVHIQTSMGDIIIRLFPDEATTTCENFLMYVRNNFYDNTLIHRVIDGFIIQGGGFVKDYIPKKTKKPIKSEARGGLKNKKWTVAMALTTDKNSAASQFFINLADNPDLDYTTKRKKGFTVFAEVIEGIDTLNKIKIIRTKTLDIYSDMYKRNVPLYNVPEKDIIIKKASILRQ